MRSRLLLLFAFVFVGGSAFSQEYIEMIDDGTYSVQEIVQSAEAYFENRDKGRGTGYKQFKRWEYMANRLMNQDGYLNSYYREAFRIGKVQCLFKRNSRRPFSISR